MTKLMLVGMIVMTFFIISGYRQKQSNEKLILKCGGTIQHDHVGWASWDGGKLVAVKCNDERRFTR